MLFSMSMLFLLSGPSLFGVEKKARKVVRIAYHKNNRQMIVDKDNSLVSGYVYDYTQTIGTYARWDIDYIPCESIFDSMP